MSRLWESDVVDIRDDPNDPSDQDEQRDVSVRADADHVVLTLPVDSSTDVELQLSRETARRIAAALDDAAGD